MAKVLLVACALVIGRSALAQPAADAPITDSNIAPGVPVPSQQVVNLAKTAHNLARNGHCDEVPTLMAHIREADGDYYYARVVLDPMIASCHVNAPPPSSEMPIGSRSPSTALWWSAGTTGAGLALLLAAKVIYPDFPSHSTPLDVMLVGSIGALVVGPTLGHTYAGKTWNRWLGVRLAGLGVVGVGAVVSLALAASVCHPDGVGCLVLGLGASAVLGGGTYAVGTIGEIATAPSAAHDYNREHHFDAQLTLAPIQSRTGLAPGVGFVRDLLDGVSSSHPRQARALLPRRRRPVPRRC